MDNNKRTYSRDSVKRFKPIEYDDEILNSTYSGSTTEDLPSTPEKTQKPRVICLTSPRKHFEHKKRLEEQSYRLELDARALRCLDAGQMLNDTVIEFYMSYLIDKSLPIGREKVHLFSTFFFNKLKQMTKTNQNDLGQLARRWDKHARLFEKDYLVIPICDSLHWLLVIVCFAYRMPADDDPIVINSNGPCDYKTNRACIIIFDSIGYRYMTKFMEPIRNFLCARWLFERPNDETRNFKDRSLFKELPAKVPRQKNSFDCGIHLLHYFEKFFQNHLHNYVLIRECQDLTLSWNLDTRQKRNSIKTLLSLESNKTGGLY